MTRVIRRGLLGLLFAFIFAFSANAQTATFHLHKEASSTTGLFQLKTAGPDGTSLAVQSANLKNQAVGEYLIKAFDTESGVPNASGVIPAGTTVTFTLWMNKTSTSGVVFPQAKLRLNNANGTLFCTATSSTALTTTLTKYTFSATTSSGISMTTADRLYVWVGVNVTTVATVNTNAALNIEGTLNGNYDSLTIVPTATPPPAISNLSPTSGSVGTSLTVTGSNFGGTQGTSTVSFNGTVATPTSWSATNIAVPVPASAASGLVVVTVNGQASNGVSFTVTASGSVSGRITRAGGTTVISGATVRVLQGTSTIASAATNSTGDYTLPALVPGTYSVEASATGFGTKRQDLVVVNGGTSTTVNLSLDAIVLGAVSYIYDAAGRLISTVGPTETITYTYDAVGNLLSISTRSSNELSIINVLPSSGEVGTVVTINGIGFSATASQNTVQFDGVAAIVTSATTTQIITSVPQLTVTGAIQIAVTTPGGTVTAPFTVLPANTGPKVQVAPANISIAPGDKVQFNAQVIGLNDQSVTWSVNGIDSGNASVGTVSASGYYSSPVQASLTAIYTIRATSVANTSVFGQAQVAVLNPAYAEALISPGISVIRPGLNAAPNAPAIAIRKNAPIHSAASAAISVRKNAATTNSSVVAARILVRHLPATITGSSISPGVSVTTGPYVQSVAPASGSRGTSFTLTITGANLSAVNGLAFLTSAGAIDSNITTSNIQINGEGTSLTATVTIGGTATLGARIVVGKTSNNHSLAVDVGFNTIQIIQ